MAALDPSNPASGPYFFPNFEESTQLAWMKIIVFTGNVATFMNYPSNALSCIGIVLNTVHFVILTRKPTRNCSTHIILASLAAINILSMAQTLVYNFLASKAGTAASCDPPDTLYFQGIAFLNNVFNSFFRRSSTWLAVSMAIIHTLSIRLESHPTFSFFSNGKCGATMIIIESLISSGFIIVKCFPFYYTGIYNKERDFIWEQPKSCANYNPNHKFVEHVLEFSTTDMKRNELIDGLTINLVPCILYPLITLILMREANRIKRKRKKEGLERKKDHTTKVVIATTVTYLITELPQLLAELVIYFSTTYGFTYFGNQLKTIFSSLSLINGCAHLFICFSFSSNYRKSISEMLRLKRKVVVKAEEKS